MSEPDPDSDSNSDGDRTMTRRAVYGSLVETVRADDDDDGDDEDDDAKATKQSMESEGDEEKQKGKDPGGNGSGNGNGNGNGSGGRRSKHRQKKAARTLSLGQLTMGKVAARAASLVGSNKSRETPSPRQSTAAASPSSNLRLDGSGPGGAHMF